jgi:hypothetical protein
MAEGGSVIQKRRQTIGTMPGSAVALWLVVLVAAMASSECGSSSPGGSDAGTGAGGKGAAGGGASAGSNGSAGGTGGGSAGAVTFSCYVPNELCTQLLVQSSGVSAEQQQCTSLQSGTSGNGCPTAGLLGCCQPKASDASHEEQCYYDAATVSVAMGLCQTTWTTTM